MKIHTTMTGSWFRSDRIKQLLSQHPEGELPEQFHSDVLEAENEAVESQMNPAGKGTGIDIVSNGEQRKSGYTSYIPNRFYGFDPLQKVAAESSSAMVEELRLAKSPLYDLFTKKPEALLGHAKIVDRLEYRGEKNAVSEAKDLLSIGKKHDAAGVFVNAPSPGVLAQFFSPGNVYRDYDDFISSLSRELSKEYRAILSVEGVSLQIDAPDITHERHYRKSEGMDRKTVLNAKVDAINDAIKGLDSSRIRVHYCFGNYSAPHEIDPPLENFMGRFLDIKADVIVAEMANPRHEGDVIALQRVIKERGWPKNKKIAVGAVDVKTPFVETPETVFLRLVRVGAIESIGAENVLGGTDCGFETFASFDNISREVALKKLASLSKGASMYSNVFS